MPGPLISITSASVEESINGNPQLIFTVELAEASDSLVSVGYRTVQGGAGALDEREDYFERSGTLTFSAGQTSRTVSVSIEDQDGIDETDEGVVLELFSPGNAEFPDGVIKLRSTGFILDDDGDTSDAGSRILSVGNPVVAEGDDGDRVVVFELALSRPSEGAITVPFTTVDGSAVAGEDYVATSGSAVFAAGETLQTVAVPLMGDLVGEPAEFFNLVTTLGAGFDSSALESVGRAEILDDDVSAGFPEVSISGGRVVESPNTNPGLEFIVTLSAPAQSAVSIDYQTIQGGGQALDEGVDYSEEIQSINFAVGETSKTINLAVQDLDSIDETDEGVVVELFNPENAVFPDGVVNLRATGFILDDDGNQTDAGNRIVSVSNPQIVEGGDGAGRFAFFDVLLSRPAETSLTVSYETADGSATAGQDYVATSGSVVFVPGQTRQFVAVPLLGDAIGEETEFFNLLTTLPAGADSTTAESIGVAEILDDDASVSLPQVSVTGGVVEESANTTPQVTFTITLSEPVGSQVTIPYRTFQAGGGARDESEDYFERSGNLLFSAGETTKTLRVTLEDLDIVDEADEGLVLELVNPSGAVFPEGELSLRATAFILDDDGVVTDDGSRSISVSDPQIVEGAGGRSVIFELLLSRPADSAIEVPYNTVDGSALAGEDYEATSGSVVFAAGQTRQAVVVPILGDAIGEAAEFFSLVTTPPAGADNSVLEVVGVAEILDDDTGIGQPQISVSAGQVVEGANTSPVVVYTVSLSEPAASTITVGYRTLQGGGAALDQNIDYTQAISTLTFNPGQSSKIINIVIQDIDVDDETDEGLVLELVNPTNAVFPDGVVTLRSTGFILDDDGVISDPGNRILSVSDPQLVEGGEGGRSAIFELALSRPSDVQLTVPFATVDGTALAGEDYVATSGNVVFAPGQTRQIVAVSILGDAVAEATEFFSLVTTPPASVDASFAEAVGFAEILDDDTAVSLPEISISGGVIVESSGTSPQIRYTVTLSESPGSTVNVSYRSVQRSDGALDEGIDFFEASSTLTFSPGVTSQTFVVTLQDLDIIDEVDEGVVVELFSPRNAVFPNGVVTLRTTGFILDDDGNVSDDGSRVLSVGDPQIIEGDTTGTLAVFDLFLSRPSDTALTVPYNTIDGSATAGDDYVATSGEVVFAPGQTRQIVAVDIVGDSVAEAAEFFQLVTTPPAGINTDTSEAVGRAEILDDDSSNSLPEISISAGSVVESANVSPQLRFVVTLSEAPSGSVDVDFRTIQRGGQAWDENIDFFESSGTLFFNTGETRKEILVSVQDIDLIDEFDEGIVVELANPNNAVFPQNAVSLRTTGFILDDDGNVSDDGSRVLAVSDVQLVEGDDGQRTALFELLLSRPSDGELTIPFTTVDGSATAGVDYVASSGSVVFAPGQMRQVVPVTVLSDRIGETAEFFSLVTSAVDGVDNTAAESVGHAEILDDDTDSGLPLVSLSSASVLESPDGSPFLRFDVTLSSPATSNVVVDFRTVQGGASALDEGADFFDNVGVVSFTVGETSKTALVQLQDLDTLDEVDEGVVVELINPVNAVFPEGIVSLRSTGFIIDDDGNVTDAMSRILSVSDPQIVEGNDGNRTAFFELKLSRPLETELTVPYTTVNGTAVAGEDFVAVAGNAVFAPGEIRQVVAVDIIGDDRAESVEQFSLLTTLSAGIDNSAAESIGRAEILDDDTSAGLPEISVSAGTVLESVNGSPQLRYTVTLSEPSSGSVQVDYRTVQNANAATGDGEDFFDIDTRLTFSPGDTSQTIVVNIQDIDLIDETDEGVGILLTNPLNAVLAGGTSSLLSTGYILDDDGNVSDSGSIVFRVDDAAAVLEGDDEDGVAVFTAQLSRPATDTITVAYSTAGITANAGSDFTATSGDLVFAPGQQVAFVAVPVIADDSIEDDEAFEITFETNGSIASFERTQAIATIVNDDSLLEINGDNMDNKLTLDEVTDVIINGGAGSDTVCLPLFANEYTLEEVSPGRYEGTFDGRSITLVDVEFVEFGSFFETTISIDDVVSGFAKDRVEKLSDLYLAFFGRAPDVSGLEFWQEQVLELGRSFAAISADFAFSVEAQALFPVGTSNREFVRNVYLNVFGREPDPGGWDFWTNLLDSLGDATLGGRGSFVGELILGAYAPTSGDADRDLLMNRHDVALEYVNVLSEQPEEGFDPAINDLLALVTADDQTRAAAGEVIEFVFSDPVTLAGALADTDYINSLFP